MRQQFEALLLYGGYSMWPGEYLEDNGDELPDPPDELEPGSLVAVHPGAFVLCAGDDMGSAGDVRLEVTDEAVVAPAPGVSINEFELVTSTGSVAFVSFDLGLIGSSKTGPGRFRVSLHVFPRSDAEDGIETHRVLFERVA